MDTDATDRRQALDELMREGMAWAIYLDQGKHWKPDGKPAIAVADMDQEWRYNASRWLERRAARIASAYSSGVALRLAAERVSPIGPSETVADQLDADAWDAEHERQSDPVGWIRTTALHRALVADLPDSSIALEAIKERAKHWSDCPVRTGGQECRCETIAAQCARCRNGERCQVCQGDGCGWCPDCSPGVPEWTVS